MSGIGHQEAARAAQRRLGVAGEALIGIVAGAQPVRIGMELRKHRVELAGARDLRAIGEVRALVTGRLELPSTQDSLLEQFLLIVGGRGIGRWMRPDERRMRDRNPLLLKSSRGVLEAAPNSGVFLREGRHR